MTDVFLGIIAASVLVMAIIQIAVIVFAARAAGRMADAVGRLEGELRPIITNLQAMSADAARATSVAAQQVERADRAFTDLAHRMDDAISAVQDAVLAPARDVFAVVQGVKAAFDAFRGGGPARRRPVHHDEEDPLFIG